MPTPVRPGHAGIGLARVLRPKGNLSPTGRWVLLALAALPLLSVALRALALPGLTDSPIGWLREIGSALNQLFSLSAVPLDQRDHVLYLLFLPTSALLVALARLTFGIRVLGFRSILISVGFHQSGIVPSLLLIVVAVATIVLMRPWLRRIRLPYYARVSVILCIVAITMVGGLLAGPWMRSDILWGAAYFPVIVLGMLAEGIAHTLERDNVVTASWRAITTILLAFLIAIVGWVPALRDLLLQFPELVLTQVVAIVMISEYLDLRLFQGWDLKVAGVLLPKLIAKENEFRVAVVRNRIDSNGGGRAGHAPPRRRDPRSVRRMVRALRRGGYAVRVLEGDASLLRELYRFLPPNPGGGNPDGLVLHLARGIRGAARAMHVPAMLEVSGIPYAGPTPLGHAMAFDPVAARALLTSAGISTPAFRLLAGPREEPSGLRYPLVVRPRHEPGVRARIVRDEERLRKVVKRIVRRYRQEALVEERVAGRQIRIALLGNAPVRCLPMVELAPGTREKLCPAPLDERLAKRIRACARAAFWACGCRDYARVDLRIGDAGDIQVIRVHSLGILAPGGSFVRAGIEKGWTFDRLLDRIVEVARARALAGEPMRPVRPRPRSAATADPFRRRNGSAVRPPSGVPGYIRTGAAT